VVVLVVVVVGASVVVLVVVVVGASVVVLVVVVVGASVVVVATCTGAKVIVPVPLYILYTLYPPLAPPPPELIPALNEAV
jgi:hypothetical protein